MVNQYPSPEPTYSKKEEALKRAAKRNDNGWHERLIRLIEATPEEAITERGCLAFVAVDARALHAPHRIVGNRVSLAEIIEQRRNSGKLSADSEG
jgi:hypothetical protein